MSRLTQLAAAKPALDQRLADELLRLLRALAVGVFRLDAESGDLVATALSGTLASFGVGFVFPKDTGLIGLAVREGRVVATPDLLAEPDVRLTPELRPWIEQAGHRSGLALPFSVEGRVVGALAVLGERGRVFAPDEVDLVQACARRMAAAVVRGWRAGGVRERPRVVETSSIVEVGQAITASLDLQAVFDLIVDRTCALLGAERAGVAVVEPDRRDAVLRFVATRGVSGEFSTRVRPVSWRDGTTAAAIHERRPVWSADLLADPAFDLSPRTRAAVEAEGYRAVLSVPLLAGNEVLGALAVYRDTPGPFWSDEVEVLQAFAAQAAVALANARLYQEAERRRREAELVAELARTINASLDLDTVLQRVAEAARDLCHGDMARIALREPATGAMVIRYRVGVRTPVDAIRIVPGKGLGGKVLVTGRAARTDNYARDTAITKDYLPLVNREGVVAAMVVPIRLQEWIEGLLFVFNQSPRPFTDQDEAVLARLAAHAAVAVRNAQLFEETERRRRTAESLASLGRLVSQSLDPDTVSRQVVESVCALLGARSSALYCVEPDSGSLVLVTAWSQSREAFRWVDVITAGNGVSGLAVRDRRPAMTPDAATDPHVTYSPELRARIEAEVDHAMLAVPLLVQDRVLGALAVADRTGRTFDAEEIAVAQAFADQAAVALENARLFREAQQALADLSRTQDQLAQARKMDAIGRLAGGIAHDFNNLLTVITGRTELLLNRLAPDDPVRTQLDLVHATAGRAAGLTRQLLAFSRKQVLQPQLLDLNAVVAGLSSMLRRLIGEDLEVTSVLAPDLRRVRADVGQLEQVIVNLAVNARDAMPLGGRLVIETSNVELAADEAGPMGMAPGRYVTLAVRDTGHGMSAETRAHLFEPFFTTKERGKGTGLGLATVYGIVTQSDGHIEVDSAPGRGATFRIYLPCVEAAGESAEPPSAARPASARGSETILLVEDEEGVRTLSREILETSGYAVLEARHGDEAMAIAERHPDRIHLLLTDVVMPGMSGRVLAERLGRARGDLRVLYVSGYTDDAIVHHGVLDLGVPFLQKPFTPAALALKVRDVLSSKGASTAPFEHPPRGDCAGKARARSD